MSNKLGAFNRADLPTYKVAVSSAKTPFLVYESVDNQFVPYPILKVYPGTVATIMPTLAGARLDVADSAAGSHPWFYPPGTPFSFFLRCLIKVVVPTEVGQTYRSKITEVKVVSDDDPLAFVDIDPITNEVPELKPIWEGANDAEKESHLNGHFYIKIADLDMTSVMGNIRVRGITQFLYSNYISFVVAGNTIVTVV